MITLCMDTSHVFLVLALIKDDQLIASVQEECWKKQSEQIFPKLIALCETAGVEPDDISQAVISKGPGSYTGVRIAMTVAKVFCAMKKIPLYTIGTLQLYAGNETCRVLTDARGKRAYTNIYEEGRALEEDSVLENDAIKEAYHGEKIIGDGHLIGCEDCWPDIAENFLKTEALWQKADNVHLVVPEYLKSSESYLVKK